VVTITADLYITERSVSFSEGISARQLAALEIVDYVAVIDEPSAVTPIERLVGRLREGTRIRQPRPRQDRDTSFARRR